MSKYKIGEIALEKKEDGTFMYWIYYAGLGPEQGGMEYGWHNLGSEDIHTLTDLLKKRILSNIDHLRERINEKNN